MDRTKILAVALAALAAVAASVAVAGSASAATWHAYEGDLHPGHAYSLDVPAGSESLEVAYEGMGLAQVALYDPAGAKLGFYELSPALTSANLASPAEGRYAIYVYDVQQGALSLRVNSEAAPDLALQEVALARQDYKLGTFGSGALDKIVTAQLHAPAVFATLLYEGSAQGLDATISSAKGAVVTITGETATAFSPGVWTAYAGQRTSTPANLDGLAYTVELHAQSFEGTLVLTTLSLGLAEPVVDPEVQPVPVAPAPLDAPVFALAAGKAVAFEAPAGELVLADPSWVEKMAKEPKEDDPEARGRGDYRYVHDVIALYAPDDTLLAYVELTGDEPMAKVELPVAGEYVAYVHQAGEDDVVLAMVPGALDVQVRELTLTEETFEFAADSFFGGQTQELELSAVPVTLSLRFGEDAFGTLGHAQVAHEDGVVASANGLILAPGVEWFAWSWQDPANFRAGAHELHVDGIFQGSLTLVSTSFVREAVEVVAEPVEAPAEEPADEPAEEPTPPPMPVAAPRVQDLLARLFG